MRALNSYGRGLNSGAQPWKEGRYGHETGREIIDTEKSNDIKQRSLIKLQQVQRDIRPTRDYQGATDQATPFVVVGI